ncbi:MAG: DUF4402 domain-containing protein [Bacteroidia bacterium]|nr:MAG: DUF4402 domain-containing protein [Bacteroidia bacterium]
MLLVAFSAGAFAQPATATANATATIVTPIAIAQVDDMSFGNIGTTGAVGTVSITTAGARAVTGGCYLPAVTGTFNAASFDVTGQANATYTIAINEVSITLSGPGADMTLDTWATDPTPTGTLSGTGTETITVGATLHVGVGQLAGAYASGSPFSITVNYN